MNKEFQDFIQSAPVEPPTQLNNQVLESARRYLEPTWTQVFSKLLAIHLGSAVLSLTVCPQFGIGPFGGETGLLGSFMNYGPVACASFCGALFLGVTAILATLFMRSEELNQISRTAVRQFTALSLLSWMIFMWAGEIPSSLYSLIWLFAGVFAGTVLLKGLNRLNRHFTLAQ